MTRKTRFLPVCNRYVLEAVYFDGTKMIAAFFNLILALGIAGLIAYLIFAIIVPSIAKQKKAQEDFDRLEQLRKREQDIEASMREKAEAELEDEVGPVEVVLGEPYESRNFGLDDNEGRPAS